MTISAHMLPGLAALPVWLRPHIEAIEDTRRAGFVFVYLPNLANMTTLQGILKTSGALNIYGATSTSDAVAVRFRLDELETQRPRPLWHTHGSVTDVVRELMQPNAAGIPVSPCDRVATCGR
ncbi:hypothetical protein ACWDKQ_22995 [Saccharopolyspora sp. NPDC000995]